MVGRVLRQSLIGARRWCGLSAAVQSAQRMENASMPRTPPLLSRACPCESGDGRGGTRRALRQKRELSLTNCSQQSGTTSRDRSFGSFQSDNVEELVKIPLDAWPAQMLVSPVRPSHAPVLSVQEARASSMVSEGNNSSSESEVPWEPLTESEVQLVRRDFGIDFGAFTFLNHGAFGATLACATSDAEEWRRYQESQPLRFFDRILLPEIVKTMCMFGAFFGAQPSDFAFVQNATTALNSVIQSKTGELGAGDRVLTLDIAYGSVKTMVREMAKRNGFQHDVLEVELPIKSPECVVALVADYLQELRNAKEAMPKVAIFDHITSNTALVLPITELAELFSEETTVIIDGAHGLWQVPLAFEELRQHGINYYISNCHKWLCSAKSVGFLWAGRAEDRASIHPTIISHGYGHGFTSDFVWDGCRDYAAVLSLQTVLGYWQQHPVFKSLESARSHTHRLAREAASHLEEAWGTKSMAICPAESMHASMHLVGLPPLALLGVDTGDGTAVVVDAQNNEGVVNKGSDVQQYLYDNGIEVPVKTINGMLYVRISAHIYNTLADYARLADVIRNVML